MARVRSARPTASAVPARNNALAQSRAAHRPAKPYKVELVQVTQHKKKLNTLNTYSTDAPEGFLFVPIGRAALIDWCKEQCRQRNMDVLTVSEKPKNKSYMDPDKLSHHVHRVGYHFPNEIVQLACNKFGLSYDELKEPQKGNWIAQSIEAYSSRQGQSGEESEQLIRDAVKALFPKIPEEAATAIITHAFKKGTDRVGNVQKLSLARRVQLAVLAHIRHVYTPYDFLLRFREYKECREVVEPYILKKLLEWRDEGKDESKELEVIFREIIVLDDDEDDDKPKEKVPLAKPQQQLQEELAGPSRITPQFARSGYTEGSDYETPPGVRHAPQRTIMNSTQGQRVLADHANRVGQEGPSGRVVPVPPQPALMEGSDGRLYQLEPIPAGRAPHQPFYEPSPRAALRYTRDDRMSLPSQALTFDRPTSHSHRVSDRDSVIPSIEGEDVEVVSSRRLGAQHPARIGEVPISGPREAPRRYRTPNLPTSQPNGEHYWDHDGKQGPSNYPLGERRFQMEPERDMVRTRPRVLQPMVGRAQQRRTPPTGDVIDLTQSPPERAMYRDRTQHNGVFARPTAYGYGSRSAHVSPAREHHGSPRQGHGAQQQGRYGSKVRTHRDQHHENVSGEPRHTYELSRSGDKTREHSRVNHRKKDVDAPKVGKGSDWPSELLY